MNRRGRSLTRRPPKRSRYVSRSRSLSLRPLRVQPNINVRYNCQYQTRGREPIVRLRRLANLGPINMSNGTAVAVGYLWSKLNQLPDFASLASVYDQYRIDWVRYTFTTLQGLHLACAIDTTDTSPPTDLNSILKYHNARVTSGPENLVVSFKPKSTILANTGGGNARVPGTNWIQTTSTDTEHYGLKYAIFTADNQPVTADIKAYTVMAEFWVSFKNPK